MEAKQEQRELDELRLIYGHLRDATSIVVTAVRPELTLLHDRLRALPNRIRTMVTAGVQQGVMYDLAAANLPDQDRSIGQISVGWPRGMRPQTRQESALYFNANTDAILPLVDIDALLENRGPTATTWGVTVLYESSESEGGSEGADSPGQADPPAE
jgi:hypothetical protein